MLAVAVLVICVTPAAFALPGLQALYLLPIIVAVYVARVRTTATSTGLDIRTLFGKRSLPWDSLKGLALTPRGQVRAVTQEGEQVALPTVRTRHLPVLALVSGGRLSDPTGLTDDLIETGPDAKAEAGTERDAADEPAGDSTPGTPDTGPAADPAEDARDRPSSGPKQPSE